MAWNTQMLVVLTGFSALTFVVGALAVPYFLIRLPEDHFLPKPPEGVSARRVARNLLGAILLLAGVAMLFLPGQGLITIMAALLLLDFPGKAELQQRILAKPHVITAINRIRERRGRPALLLPIAEVP